MAAVERIVIPRCIGCGAMREFERCEGGCHEEYLELVAAGDFDALDAAQRSAQARLEALLPALHALAQLQPAGGDPHQLYLSLSQAARQALRTAPPLLPAAATGLPEPLRIGVWRCVDCGAVDAPQECLGICIWRRFEWVGADAYELGHARAERVLAHVRRVSGLLGRVGHTTPRDGGWERSRRALGREARELVERYENAAATHEAHV